MLDNWTLKQFAEKAQWEGGLEAMVHYCGRVCITDHPEFEKAWNRFVIDYEFMQDILFDYEEQE
jgi:hypothetical protein